MDTIVTLLAGGTIYACCSSMNFGKLLLGPKKPKAAPGKPGKVAITGSSGIMGSRLCPALREDGWEVIGITRGKGTSQGGPGRDSSKEVDLTLVDRICDFSKPESMDSGVFEGCTHVFHLAADGRPGASFDEILKSNIVSTYHAYECAKRCGVKRFVLASTNHVQHGDSMEIGGGPGSIDRSRLGGKRMTLSDPAVPDSYYAASKLHNEAIGMLYSKVKSHLEVVSLRIGWVLYDDPTELKDTEFEHYLRAMFLSRRDMIGFCKAALNAPIPEEDRGYLCAYALSNNSQRVFDLEETIEKLGYTPLDSADDFKWSK
jgi:nucleoside-diphosphate-sugar epimerase